MNFKKMRETAVMMMVITSMAAAFGLSFPASASAEPGAAAVENEYALTSGEVGIETDKALYAPGESIKLSVTNTAAAAFFIHKSDSIAIHEIERLGNDGAWTKLLVRDPNVRYDIGPPEEFKPGENYKFDWAPCFYELKGKNANGYDNYEKIPFGPGKYRLVFIYQKRPSGEVSTWKWLLADSNEFEIAK
mgnify:CR=1 FL=1